MIDDGNDDDDNNNNNNNNNNNHYKYKSNLDLAERSCFTDCKIVRTSTLHPVAFIHVQ